MKGKGLKDYDIIKSFRETIRRKIKITAAEKQSPEWPYSPEEIVEMLDKGPLPEIYNTIFHSVHGKYVANKYGYAKTESSQLSTKIWSMACSWEALLKKEKNTRPLLTGLTIHRLTGRKEVVQMLNKLNSCSLYNEKGIYEIKIFKAHESSHVQRYSSSYYN